MRIPGQPNLAYAIGYVEGHGADSDRPEHELWRATLRQAADDLLALCKKMQVQDQGVSRTDPRASDGPLFLKVCTTVHFYAWIQQALPPPPRQGFIERTAEAIAQLRRTKGSA